MPRLVPIVALRHKPPMDHAPPAPPIRPAGRDSRNGGDAGHAGDSADAGDAGDVGADRNGRAAHAAGILWRGAGRARSAALNLVLPPRCAGCAAIMHSDGGFCPQ
ncbi:MAG: hypothetical protein ACKOUM_12675, partial [Sphingopyxis sp.]